MGDLVGAIDAYEAGLKIDPNNAGMRNDLAAVQRAMDKEMAGGMS
jgi:stress-induced-phosphoprotein 1